jgi:putative restriction endonuclease
MTVTTLDILQMNTGDTISKPEMKKLITESKKPSSVEYWQGDEYIINDTYQKGINWIGDITNPKAVIIKSRPGKYIEDSHVEGEIFYAFQARNQRIDKEWDANKVLIQSKEQKYPLLYFIDAGSHWIFLGKFIVKNVRERDVELVPFIDESNYENNISYTEGNIKIIEHIIHERNINLVKKIKQEREWTCDICCRKMENYYDVAFIEAHHKELISNFQHEHEVKENDIVLLCPNCHTAVHYLMKEKLSYDEIKVKLQKILQSKCTSRN